jgi:large subunit ribosomal protein L17
MRHQVAGRKLNRDHNQRKALFKNLINSLVIHGEIKTTESKAKAVRGLIDKLITKGKEGTLHSKRLIAAFLQDKLAVNKITEELGPLFKNRPGGFTRIIRLGKRQGDDAMVVKLELVEKPAAKAPVTPVAPAKPKEVKKVAKNENKNPKSK